MTFAFAFTQRSKGNITATLLPFAPRRLYLIAKTNCSFEGFSLFCYTGCKLFYLHIWYWLSYNGPSEVTSRTPSGEPPSRPGQKGPRFTEKGPLIQKYNEKRQAWTHDADEYQERIAKQFEKWKHHRSLTSCSQLCDNKEAGISLQQTVENFIYWFSACLLLYFFLQTKRLYLRYKWYTFCGNNHITSTFIQVCLVS